MNRGQCVGRLGAVCVKEIDPQERAGGEGGVVLVDRVCDKRRREGGGCGWWRSGRGGWDAAVRRPLWLAASWILSVPVYYGFSTSVNRPPHHWLPSVSPRSSGGSTVGRQANTHARYWRERRRIATGLDVAHLFVSVQGSHSQGSTYLGMPTKDCMGGFSVASPSREAARCNDSPRCRGAEENPARSGDGGTGEGVRRATG